MFTLYYKIFICLSLLCLEQQCSPLPTVYTRSKIAPSFTKEVAKKFVDGVEMQRYFLLRLKSSAYSWQTMQKIERLIGDQSLKRLLDGQTRDKQTLQSFLNIKEMCVSARLAIKASKEFNIDAIIVALFKKLYGVLLETNPSDDLAFETVQIAGNSSNKILKDFSKNLSFCLSKHKNFYGLFS